jgi:hypothetical protein
VTTGQRRTLIDSLARALSWSVVPQSEKQRYTDRARAIVDELNREANTGDALQLRRALEIVKEKSA